MLQTAYLRGTKDTDILEMSDLLPETKERLLILAGKGTELHQRGRLYVEIVQNGVPFLARPPNWRGLDELNADLRHLDLFALDVIDVVVSKLKRFNANDQADIEAMINLDIVPHGALIGRFRSAVEGFECDARAEDLPRYVAHFRRIERDTFDVAETEIELPDWI